MQHLGETRWCGWDGDFCPRRFGGGFWRSIVAGWSTEAASAAVGVERATGLRWFTEAGGMSPMDLAEPQGRYLTFSEREEIALGRAAHSIRRNALVLPAAGGGPGRGGNADLIAAIERFIDAWNDRCTPFTWTKDPDTIIVKAT
jgi:hypothetical protein